MTQALSVSPPFQRGATWFNGQIPTNLDGTTDTTSGSHIEGTEWIFDDLDMSQPNYQISRTNRKTKCRAVRNVGAAAVLPGRLVTFATTESGVKFGNRIDGYSDVVGQRAYPVDEWLPAAGAVVNDIFWIVTEGPAMCYTDLANMQQSFAMGGYVAAITAATSGATTAGRIQGVDWTSVTQVANRVGAAITAATTNQTNTAILVDVGKW